jgi:hypothetical protein
MRPPEAAVTNQDFSTYFNTRIRPPQQKRGKYGAIQKETTIQLPSKSEIIIQHTHNNNIGGAIR